MSSISAAQQPNYFLQSAFQIQGRFEGNAGFPCKWNGTSIVNPGPAISPDPTNLRAAFPLDFSTYQSGPYTLYKEYFPVVHSVYICSYQSVNTGYTFPSGTFYCNLCGNAGANPLNLFVIELDITPTYFVEIVRNPTQLAPGGTTTYQGFGMDNNTAWLEFYFSPSSPGDYQIGRFNVIFTYTLQRRWYLQNVPQ